jgi:hypothetical protein
VRMAFICLQCTTFSQQFDACLLLFMSSRAECLHLNQLLRA